MPTNLVIQQVPGEAEFQVTRTHPFKTSKPVTIPSPYTYPVEGRPNSNLMVELQWYLEKFLEYPFPPETDHADRIIEALKSWGEEAFTALFGNLSGGPLFQAATVADYKSLTLQIATDDAGVLSWPWEALRDPQLGTPLAHACQIERRLSEIRDASALSANLPTDRVNILLVVARPYGNEDVRYRSIARSLVELIKKDNLPAHVDLLRPPTFAQLREHLKLHPSYYHILHFDGHGSYSSSAGSASQHSYKSVEGKLVFETDEGKDDPITAAQLNDLLRDYAVPGVVLNACQSAMVTEESGDAFTSVAAALLRSGARSVVAMAYSLYVSGAQEFLLAFYKALFETGSMAEAARAGRQQMRAQRKRVCARGKFDLDDWLLPVLYQQSQLDLSFTANTTAPKPESRLPEEFRKENNPYGFIGRDGALLALERAMHRAPAGILIQGLGGIGKTTLARGFVRWLEDTNGLGEGALWLDFREIRSAEYVLNQIGEPIFGPNFGLAGVEAKLEALVKALREHRFVIVWDNFESASGIAGTSITANLPDKDRALLAQFLDGLRGGATKVLITTRSEEDWLGPQRRWKLPLSGMDGEERWEYCETILRDLGLTVNRDDKDYADLMKQLGGHPLAMRVMLPQLEKHSAAEIANALRRNLQELKLTAGDEAYEQLFAALRFIEQALPESLRPLLKPLSLHEAYVDLDYLEDMAKKVPGDWSRAQIDQLAGALTNAGLLRDVGQATYELHPALTGYLRSHLGITTESLGSDEWNRAFVDVMASVSASLAPRELHDQRIRFHLHDANLHTALVEAERLSMESEEKELTEALALCAINVREFAEAERLLLRLARHERACWTAFHHLGLVAQERHKLLDAEKWHQKALEISKLHGRKNCVAISYHQLGIVTQLNRNFDAAERWYLMSIEMKEQDDNKLGVAITCHQLGTIFEERLDLDAAEHWYLRSVDIKKHLGDEEHCKATYHHLGNVAQMRREFDCAQQWYRKSLDIKEKHRDDDGAAYTYAELGNLASEVCDFHSARSWYMRALAIWERNGNDYHAAQVYRCLGALDSKECDFGAAENWHRKALGLWERLGYDHGAALSLVSLALLALKQNRLVEAGRSCVGALAKFRRSNDHYAETTALQILAIYKSASADEKRELEALWTQAGFGPFPPPENP